jgi:hypothetical protein
MHKRSSRFAVLGLLAFVPQGPPVHAEEAAGSAVEEIYVLRSVRETRVAATDFCSKLETPTSEDNYTFYSAAVNSETGLVTNPKAKAAGKIHGCFGKSAAPGVIKFFGEFEANGVTGKATGDCQTGRPDHPEAGLKLFACLFDLSDLSAPYIGGMLTTNSLNSKSITGEASDPAGYTQVSIATVRFWKKRGG